MSCSRGRQGRSVIRAESAWAATMLRPVTPPTPHDGATSRAAARRGEHGETALRHAAPRPIRIHALQHAPGEAQGACGTVAFGHHFRRNPMALSLGPVPFAVFEPNYNGAYRFRFISPGSERAARVLSKLKSLLLAAAAIVGCTAGASAQSVELRQWRGSSAIVRQPEQVMAYTMAEWRSLWMRVGAHAPDMFEPGRMNAIGIFLGLRPGPYSVNVLSAGRRRDRIMVVFEERGPSETMVAQHAPPPSLQPAPRALSAGPGFGGGAAAGFVAPGATGLAPPSPPAGRPPQGPPTSPWAIVLINRTDLPITVEQRLYR